MPELLDVKLPAELVAAWIRTADRVGGGAEGLAAEILRATWWQGAVAGFAVGVLAAYWVRCK